MRYYELRKQSGRMRDKPLSHMLPSNNIRHFLRFHIVAHEMETTHICFATCVLSPIKCKWNRYTRIRTAKRQIKNDTSKMVLPHSV